jgi:hypothetical protein
MNPLGWVTLFANFAGVAKDLVDQFAEKHPELRDEPKAAEDAKIDNAIDEMIKSKFAK